MRMKIPPPRGFTLVEILVVLLIIGVLASIAMPSFIRARENSRAKACQHNLKNIMGAKERWAMDHRKGPSDTPEMDDLALPVGYLKSVPQCPSNGAYTVGDMRTLPVCSIGGQPGEVTAHMLP